MFSCECLNGSIQEVLTPPPQGLLQLSQGPQLFQEASTAESDDWTNEMETKKLWHLYYLTW